VTSTSAHRARARHGYRTAEEKREHDFRNLLQDLVAAITLEDEPLQRHTLDELKGMYKAANRRK